MADNISLMAFDYGLRSIGVAVGQTATGNASALTELRARDGIPNWDEIKQLLDEWQPDLVLVGLPLNMDDTENDFCPRARKFANRIHGRFGHRVEMVDERLSSVAAKEEHLAAGGSTHFRSDPVDAIAARIILETWLGENTEH
ncbi:Holliday junction resolvase RuvX [Gilvimarinus agarilyticus]|uniref:Holliday junction resolvase RuvX n=1 Tax=unclassified Gilvimarinus TaxID=2642066 RepID=UPI001C09AEDE|nr:MULTISPECIES: Holliday junction resolvase RuvX [unclassified Gilvimarinus]MBU2884437.1 Holliday junction resolvase RuvX [Gilvimarinus agarilyticus]MDO6569573.1 Holliday junction resolvase RuvX [Gilvimarinus sp. 2_MG-2023]MDO6748102.1 Holliday junction resolvase RuvX [Gilvimarinus sp. 1_MG-2023]